MRKTRIFVQQNLDVGEFVCFSQFFFVFLALVCLLFRCIKYTIHSPPVHAGTHQSSKRSSSNKNKFSICTYLQFSRIKTRISLTVLVSIYSLPLLEYEKVVNGLVQLIQYEYMDTNRSATFCDFCNKIKQQKT